MEILLTWLPYIVPPLITGLLGWFCPQPGKKGIIQNFINKVGGETIWLPVINRLQKEYSGKAFNIIFDIVKEMMSHKKDERHPLAVQKSKSALLQIGENISDTTLNMLIEVAVDKVKSLR